MRVTCQGVLYVGLIFEVELIGAFEAALGSAIMMSTSHVGSL